MGFSLLMSFLAFFNNFDNFICTPTFYATRCLVLSLHGHEVACRVVHDDDQPRSVSKIRTSTAVDGAILPQIEYLNVLFGQQSCIKSQGKIENGLFVSLIVIFRCIIVLFGYIQETNVNVRMRSA